MAAISPARLAAEQVEIAPGRWKPVGRLSRAQLERAERILARKAALWELASQLERLLPEDTDLSELPPLTRRSRENGALSLRTALAGLEAETRALEALLDAQTPGWRER